MSNVTLLSDFPAVMMAANDIRGGGSNLILAGGMESMSRAPFLMPLASRAGGMPFGMNQIQDTLQLDGLTDAATGTGMGLCGEKCAATHTISRDDSDRHAAKSYERAIEGRDGGFFADEIVPISIPATKKTDAFVMSSDEGLGNVSRHQIDTNLAVQRRKDEETQASISSGKRHSHRGQCQSHE